MPEILIWLKSTIETLNSYPQSLTLDQWFFVGGLLALIIAIIIHEEFRFFNWFFNRISPEPKTECGTLVGSFFLAGVASLMMCVCMQTVNRVAKYIEYPIFYQTNYFTDHQRTNSLIQQAMHLENLKNQWINNKGLGIFVDIKKSFDRFLPQLHKKILSGKLDRSPVAVQVDSLYRSLENRPDFLLFKCLIENGVTNKTLNQIRKSSRIFGPNSIGIAFYNNRDENNEVVGKMGYYSGDSIVIYLDYASNPDYVNDAFVHEFAHSMTSRFIDHNNMFMDKIHREGVATYVEMKCRAVNNERYWTSGYMDTYLPLFTIMYNSQNLNDAFRTIKDTSGYPKSFISRGFDRYEQLLVQRSNHQSIERNITDACKNRWKHPEIIVSYYREFAKQIPGGENRLDVFLNKFKFWFSN